MTKQEIIDKVDAIKKAIENKEYDFYYDEIDTVSIEDGADGNTYFVVGYGDFLGANNIEVLGETFSYTIETMEWESDLFDEIEKTFEDDGEAESLMDEIKDLLYDLDEFICCSYECIDDEVSVFKKMTGNTDNYESIWYEDFKSVEE